MITVSVCMIVKNEEQVLERCLKSLMPIADEVIVVDTGSTDRTKEIAGKYTDKIYDFEWVQDFSKARNFSFSKANMDYIYVADADEEIDEENIEKFKLLKEAMLPEIEIVQMWYQNCGNEKTTENYEKEYRPKLYKRIRTFTWEDPVHEMVRMTPVVFDSEVTVMHKPVGNHGSRDLAIFNQMISEKKELSDRLKKMYARELFMAGTNEELTEAKPYFEQIQRKQDSSIAEMKDAGILLARQARESDNFSTFLKNTLKDMLTDPSSEMCVEIAKFFETQGDYEEAILWYYNAAFETEATMDLRTSAEIPLLGLSVCYNMLADALPNECINEKQNCRKNALYYDRMRENSR